MDIKNEYLKKDLEEKVYTDSPPGFDRNYDSKVCKLRKSLYDLKQSPRAWFEKFTQSIKKQDYTGTNRSHLIFKVFIKR